MIIYRLPFVSVHPLRMGNVVLKSFHRPRCSSMMEVGVKQENIHMIMSSKNPIHRYMHTNYTSFLQ